MKFRILHLDLIPPAERLDSRLAGEDELDVRWAHGEGEDTEKAGTTRQLESGLDNLHSSQRDHLSIHRVRLLERYGHEDQDVHAEQSGPEVEDDEELERQLDILPVRHISLPCDLPNLRTAQARHSDLSLAKSNIRHSRSNCITHVPQ